MNSLRLALRTLTRTPFVTLVAVVSLALGIGANGAIYSLFDQILLQRLPVQEPDRLVNLSAPGPKPGSQSCNTAGSCEEVFSYPMFRDLEQSPDGLSGIAAHRVFRGNLARGGQTVSGEGMLVSGSYFPLLGVRPALGRLLGPADDDKIGGHFVAVLGHDYWRNRLGSDPSVLNDEIIINGKPYTIVGVAQPGFRGTTLGNDPDVYVPITMRSEISSSFDGFDSRRTYWAYLFGRLKPGVSIQQARTEINARYSAILNEVEAPLQKGMSEPTMRRFRARQILVSPGYRGQSFLHREAETPLLMLFTITGIVLLIACANIANLLLARGSQRGAEMAIRSSLGASRWQLLRQLLVESCVLALLGGAASLLVAKWTLGVIVSALPGEVGSALVLGIRPGMILFAGALSLGTGLLFGLYPALRATRPDLAPVLRADAGRSSATPGTHRFRSGLVVGQLALSMALMVAAGLFIRSLINISRVDLGLEAHNVVTFSIAPQLNGYEPQESQALFRRAEEELAAIPGVAAVSAATVPLLADDNWDMSVHVEGFESGPDIDTDASFNEVGPGYFRTLGIPLLAGREFTAADDAGAPKVAIVNEAFTRKFHLDGRNAVGKRMSRGGDDLDIEIIGVVQDAKYSDVKGEVPAQFAVPYRQDDALGLISFYLRTVTEPDLIMRAVPGVIHTLDPNLPVDELKTLQMQVHENVAVDRLIGALSVAFAMLATLLAAVGLYGVLAYTIAQRTREIGVRMALGADGPKLRRMVLAQVGRMTLVGGAIGVFAALGLGRGARSLLYGVEGQDPLVIAVVAVALAGVALAAAYFPARRASRIDPIQALRYE